MTLRSRFVMAYVILLAVLLAGLAVLGLWDIYLNHIVRDCGADCVRLSSGRTVQRGF